MPYRWETFSVQPQGGLVENVAKLRQGIELPGSAARLVNFEPSIEGGYRRINGYSKFDAAEVTGTGQVFGVAYFRGAVIAVRNGNIYRSTGGGWTSIATGRTHTTKHRFHTINLDGAPKLIGVDGSNYPYSYDGTTFANINGTTDILGASHVVEFKDHVFYSSGDLVTFSVPFDETDFDTGLGAGSFRVKDNVTGMIVFRERLYIFTETTIDVLDGDSSSDFRLTSVAEDIGCIAEDTIQEVAGDVAFLSNDGVRLLGATERIGDFSNQVTSRPIQKNFNDFRETYTRFSSTVIRGKSQYRIFGFTPSRGRETTEGYIATQFEAQNPNSFAWGEIVGIEVYSIDSQVWQGDEYIVFVGEETGFVYRMESGNTFDGIAITSQYWTPYLSFNDPTFRKTLYKLIAHYTPENDIEGSFSINFDFNRQGKIQPEVITFSKSGGGAVWGSFTWDSGVWAGAAPDAVLETQVIGSGQNAQIRFEFAGSAPFVVDTLLIEFATEDRN